MKKNLSLFAAASITSVVIAGAAVSPAFAWHPKGTIVKYVQNETTNSILSDANDVGAAIAAKPGDTLKYVITVSNTGTAAANHDDDMANTVMTDTLPTGVALVSSPSQRQITENLGTLTPGQKVTKTYVVTVTSTTNDDVITNKACFTGNSIVNDNPQSGCDIATVKVSVPPTPTPTPTPAPTPTPTPTPPVTPPVQPTVLPNTGAGDFIMPALIVSVLGYAGYLLRLKRRTATQN